MPEQKKNKEMNHPKCLFLVRLPPFRYLYRPVCSVLEEEIGVVPVVSPLRSAFDEGVGAVEIVWRARVQIELRRTCDSQSRI